MERSCSGLPHRDVSPEPSRQDAPEGRLRFLLTEDRPSLAEEPEQSVQPAPTPASLPYFVVTLCTLILSHSGPIDKAK